MYLKFKKPQIFTNVGFMFSTLLFVLGIIVIFIMIKRSKTILERRFLKVIFFDAEFFDSEKLSPEEYFTVHKKLSSKKNALRMITPKKLEKRKTINLPSPAGVTLRPLTDRNINRDDFQLEPNLINIPGMKRTMSNDESSSRTGSDRSDLISNNSPENSPKPRRMVLIDDGLPIKNFTYKKTILKNNFVITPYSAEIEESSAINSKKNLTVVSNPETIPRHFFTLKDYDNLSVENRVKYDRRPIFKYLKDTISEDHSILKIFFKHSLMDPIFLRVTSLFITISLNFCLNAIFYSDEYIEKKRNSLSTIKGMGIFYTLAEELPKSFWSLLATIFVMSVLKILLIKPRKVKKEMLEAYESKDKHTILLGE